MKTLIDIINCGARGTKWKILPSHTHTHVESTQNPHTHRRQSRRAFAIYFPLLIDFIAFAINEYRMSYNKNTENEKKTISSSLVKKKKKLKRDESEDEFNNLLDFARNREEEKNMAEMNGDGDRNGERFELFR